MKLFRFFLAVTLLVAGTSVHAFRSSSAGNQVTFAPLTVNAGNVGGYTMSTASNGTVLLKGGPRMSLPGGRSIPLDVTGGVPRARVAGAIGRFLGKVGPLGYVLNAGAAAYVLANELGFGLDDSTGELLVDFTQTAGLCTVGPCTGYGYASYPIAYQYSKEAACAALETWLKANHTNQTYNTGPGGLGHAVTPSTNGCVVYRKMGETFTDLYLDFSTNTLPVQVPTPRPSSIAEFEAAINAKENNWNATDALQRALADALAAGETVETNAPSVTGPATSPGPVTTTVNNTNNTTTTSTTTHHHAYAGNTVTTTTTTTNVTVNNTTNEVVDSSTTTEEPVIPESETPDVSFSDAVLPQLPKLYEPKYPDGMTGVWNSKKAQLDSAPLLSLLGDLMPTVAGSGACPTWAIPLDVGIADFGSADFSIPCWIWDFAKVVIIVSSLLLARRLVFGG